MGLLSTSVSITRYRVDGTIKHPIIDTVGAALKKHAIIDIDDQPLEQIAGWTCMQDPFNPDFEKSRFVVGTYFIFSLRIDKKSVPPKLFQKHWTIESTKALQSLEREFLSKDEKTAIKERVFQKLNRRMPAVPCVYDLLWQYETGELWFFSNLKAANELLETIFFKSFGLSLIRQIPYTLAAFDNTLSAAQRDALGKLAHDQERV